jgi:Tfp pilus assembly protein PilN
MTYSSSLALGRKRYSGRNQNSTLYKETTKLGPISNSIILIVLACLLGLLYLTQVTKTNALGYQINELKEEQSSLQAENDELQLASARLQALERAKSSDVAKGLVSIAPHSVLNN